ncbi:nucleotide-binding universal stress UspA family protein [Friedmanniella endophytica]|uniref:Nucleotide-binding universal stress UspA family protein n=1 Tax=Microlunatus kandeliicorticis TaxID=1759536 RepID=A0A7W3P6V9_9ACTN|nr:universal stress protein [Microlunatus kandeliicorticis]MBA8795388.1 nucleotide-binding universal stress UspA family protein [Microlunatus kandeliicorticis]
MSESTDTAPTSAETSAGGPTIIVGYTPKPEGHAALERAEAEARLRGARLIVVNTAGEDEPDDLQSRLADSPVPAEVRRPSDPLDPAEELISAAEETDAEFIVIGLRKRSPLGKLLLGSNAQRVLLDAGCPVLAVKAR